jgi:hypothetical protein
MAGILDQRLAWPAVELKSATAAEQEDPERQRPVTGNAFDENAWLFSQPPPLVYFHECWLVLSTHQQNHHFGKIWDTAQLAVDKHEL